MPIDDAKKLEAIKNYLCRYFEVDDNGNPSSSFDPDYTAQAFVDDVHEIIGSI